MSRILIINADDFGQSDAITDGILQAAAAGAVTSTTLLANAGESAERALRMAAQLPGLGVGLHLNLTQGRSLSDPRDVPDLVTADGKFRHGPVGLLRRSLLSPSFRGQVRREWRVQIEWMLSRGRRPTHLDSHKHVHMAPPLFAIACELAAEAGIRCIRLVREPFWPATRAPRNPSLSRLRGLRQLLAGQALRLTLAGVDRRRRRRAGLNGNEWLLGFANTGGMGGRAIDAVMQSLPPGVSELMTHPGLADPVGAGRLTQSRPMELAALLAGDLPRKAASLGIVMTNYAR
jgi:predicted glycoside hydrolase/deacetylase ChbG (UPF0249 family)